MPNDYFHRVTDQTPTRLWINNPTADELEAAIDAGAISCTTNPTYGAKLLSSEKAYVHGLISDAIAATDNQEEAADRVVQAATARLIERFLPLYEKSGGTEGFVTIQSDPRRDEDSLFMIDAALRYRALGPNFMAKIPVTTAGLVAIEHLIVEDVPICATEVFAIDQAIAVCETYRRASEKSKKRPPFFVTHITGIFDEYLGKLVQKQGIGISPESLAWAGSSVARKEYRLLRERGLPGTLLGGGARSTRHFTDFVGGDIHITINWSTALELLEWDPPVANRIDVATPSPALAELSARIPDFRRAYDEGALPVAEFSEYGPVQFFRDNFIAGYNRLLAEIEAEYV
jgi:transaldolase